MSSFNVDAYYANKEKSKVREAVSLMPQHLLEIFVQILNDQGQRGYYFQSCLTCTNWDGQTEMCEKFNARPPAKVIVNSCEHYCDIDIPF